MCTLLVEVTHFNFRVNLMSTIVAALSRKSWDQVSRPFPPPQIAFRLQTVGSPDCVTIDF